MKSNSFSPYFFLISFLVLLASCDNDSNELGANIVGDDNFELGTPETYSVNAYNQALGPVEISNLGIHQFGIYNNPVFGKMTANMVTQLQLAVENPTAVTGGLDLAKAPLIKSVQLYIPYFSRVTDAKDAFTPSLYELDSIYGEGGPKMNLQIYESTFYLRDTDPVTGEAQKYYSNQIGQFTSNSFLLNNSSDVRQNTQFEFSAVGDTIAATGEGLYPTKVVPGMTIDLDKTFFQNKLFTPEGTAAMINNNVFKNYMRGLYFKVSQSGSDPGRLAMMNFGQGKITITYKQNDSTEDLSLILNLSGNNVNLIENEYSSIYDPIVNATSANVNGDERLYLKGGQGSMAVIELFKEPGQLEALRAKRNQWLVNDASLTFHIDNNQMGLGTPPAEEPNRIYLYDLNNKRALIDYTTDQSVSVNNVKYNKKLHGGTIIKAGDRGTMYKIRITNHIRKLIANDTVKNVRLGLVVTENINVTSNKSLKTPKVLPVSGTFDPFTIKDTPLMNIANPFGTILWGSSAPEDKRVKLTIYYTKPNQ